MTQTAGHSPTTVSRALAESWSRDVFTTHMYVPASLSVTSLMVRLSESTLNLCSHTHTHTQ